MINKIIENINVNNMCSYYHILGDKGYITKNIFKINNKPVHVLTYNKKNTINKNKKYNEFKLKKK